MKKSFNLTLEKAKNCSILNKDREVYILDKKYAKSYYVAVSHFNYQVLLFEGYNTVAILKNGEITYFCGK